MASSLFLTENKSVGNLIMVFQNEKTIVHPRNIKSPFRRNKIQLQFNKFDVRNVINMCSCVVYYIFNFFTESRMFLQSYNANNHDKSIIWNFSNKFE